MPPSEDRSLVTANEIAIIAFSVLIILIILIATAFYLLQEWEEAMADHEESRQFSHPRDRARIDPVRNKEIPVPVNYAILGNTTGTQYLTVLDTTGVLWMIMSNDSFQTLMVVERLDSYDVQALDGVGLSMGYASNGSVFVIADNEEGVSSWVQGMNGSFEACPMSPPAPKGPTVRREDLPEPRYIDTPSPGWDTIWLDGLEVVVLGYYYESGCMGNYYSPSIVYRRPGEEWSDIVMLDKANLDDVAINGSGMDDMLIVAYDGHRGSWLIYAVTDTSVLDAGQPQV